MISATDLLIAPPNLPDPRFKEAVIIMLSTGSDQGNLGLCVNKPLDYTVNDLKLDISHDRYLNFPIFWGGPMNRQSIWMLHSSDWSLNETVELSDSWSMTSNMEMFAALGDGFTPQQFRLFAGYCSWAPRQLEMELSGQRPWNPRHSWLVAQGVDPEWLFEQPVELVWSGSTTLSCHQAVDSWLS